MIRATIFLLTFYLTNLLAYAQDTIRIYDRDGQAVLMEDIALAARDKKYIFFGELHGHTESHQVQLQLLHHLASEHGKSLVLGMEMFEADVQPIIDEYFDGFINQRSFEAESRIWNNYSDYKPLVEFAKEHDIKVVATNIPRRYANAVYHNGISILDSLSEYARQFLPTLPMQIDTTLQSYRSLREMTPGHGGENMLNSQALKDATMAKYIIENSQGNEIVLHLNGSYHSNDWEGIISFLHNVPKDNVLTITTILEGELTSNDTSPFQKADFTVVATPRS